MSNTRWRRTAGVIMAGLTLAGPIAMPVMAMADPTSSEVTIDQEKLVHLINPTSSKLVSDEYQQQPEWSTVSADGTETFAKDIKDFSGLHLAAVYDDASDSMVAWRQAATDADHYATTTSVDADGTLHVRVMPDSNYWNGEHGAVNFDSKAITTTLDANGGAFESGTTKTYNGKWSLPASHVLVAGDEAEAAKRPTLKMADPYQTPSRPGYTFTGWNTAKDGSGTSYPDASYVRYTNTTLYAQWKANTYTVAYDANGGEGSMSSQNLAFDQAGTVADNGFTYEGQDFLGWNTKPDGSGTTYQPGDSIAALTTENGATVTLYAQWDTNIALSVPTTVPFHAKSDGTVIAPTNWSVKNVGKTAIETADVSVANASPDVSYKAAHDGADWFSVTDGEIANGKHITLASGQEAVIDWSMDDLDKNLDKADDGLVHAGTLSFDFTRVK